MQYILFGMFSRFTDFLNPYSLYRGKGSHDDADEQVGCLKGAVCIYETPADPNQCMLSKLPSNGTVEILVRVYVVEVCLNGK